MSNTQKRVNPVRFLCPVCGQNLSVQSLGEHISEFHLQSRCLQIARCVTKGCKEKKDIFTGPYVTEHMTFPCELRFPSKGCKHRNNCQALLVAHLNESYGRLGPVDRNGKSASKDPDTLKRINQLLKLYETQEKSKLKLRVPTASCFVKDLQDNNGNRDSGYDRSRNSAYDCSNAGNGGERGRSPGYSGRSPGYGSRSPGYAGRSPGYGSRSPGYDGRSPGYDGDRSPGYGGDRSPAYGRRSPGHCGDRSPAYGGRSPGYGNRSPGYGNRSPGYGNRSPGYGEDRSPGYGERNRSPAPTGNCGTMDRSPAPIGNRSPGYFETELRSEPLFPVRRDSWSSQMDGSSHSSVSLVPQGFSFRKEMDVIVKKELPESTKGEPLSSKSCKMNNVQNIPSVPNAMNNRPASVTTRPTINIRIGSNASRNIRDGLAPSSSQNDVSSSQSLSTPSLPRSQNFPPSSTLSAGSSYLGNISELSGVPFTNNYSWTSASSYSTNRFAGSNKRTPQPHARSLLNDEQDFSNAKKKRDELNKRT